MTRRRKATTQPGASALSQATEEERTKPAQIAEGRGLPGMPIESAQAIADASKAAGFDPPPQVQAVLDAASAQPAETAETNPEA